MEENGKEGGKRETSPSLLPIRSFYAWLPFSIYLSARKAIDELARVALSLPHQSR